jgi:hydroxymethylglutaryl-CoA lyase
MVDKVLIREVGTREGFQFEPPGIPTARKVELIDALAGTGVRRIQTVSFVSPRSIPQMSDAEDVIAGLHPNPDVAYQALWFNVRGLRRAQDFGFLTMVGSVSLSASSKFAARNWGSPDRALSALNDPLIEEYARLKLPVAISVAAAFGCNFEGRVDEGTVITLLGDTLTQLDERGLEVIEITLSDTMAWASPQSIKRLCDAVRTRFPDLPVSLHLHDTRGLGIANAMAALEVGIDRFDSAIAGLGGCPYAGHRGAAGNIATEDFVLLCHELGIETGIDPVRLLAAAALAEEVVGHPGSSRSLRGGHLTDTGVLNIDLPQDARV